MGVGKRKARPWGSGRLIAALCACAAAFSAPLAADDPADPSTALATTPPMVEAPFFDEFEAFTGPRPDLQIPDHAVDLAIFDPPVEDPVLRSLGTGVASYYGRRFHGRRTANGERFDMHAMTAAHKTLPFGTRVRVTNPRNGQSVIVRINDRGPFSRGRVIDLSRAAATQIGLIRRGHGMVEIDVLR